MRTPDDDDLRRAHGVASPVAARLMRHRAWEGIDVEDIVQEVLLRFSQLDLDKISNADAWVTTMTRNRCADVWAAAKRHDQRQIGRGPDPDIVKVDEALSVVLKVVGPSAAAISPMVVAHALEELSVQERSLLLRHADGWSNAEIAEEFDYASAQSAAVAISRAKKKVRQRFDSPSQRGAIVDPQRVY